MAKHLHINEQIDVIHDLLDKSPDGIIGIMIPRGDDDFNPAGFKSYIERHNASGNRGYLDMRGPFNDNFVTSLNGHPEPNIFYIGKGKAIEEKMQAYLDGREGTAMEKARNMFKNVLLPYPVYLFGKQYVAVEEPHAHLDLKEDAEDARTLEERKDGPFVEVKIDEL